MALSIIDCILMPFPVEISAKILYLSGAMDFDVNARKYLQVNPRKIKELKTTSDLYKMCEKRSEFISNNSTHSRYDFRSIKKIKKLYDLIFYIYLPYSYNGTEPFTRCYRFICKGRSNGNYHII
jgi:hypothetical protein